MTDDVSDLVLKNNYRQTFALSVAEHQVASCINKYSRFMVYLESQGKRDRELEFLPSDKLLVESMGSGKYLSRPIVFLSVMQKYSLKKYFSSLSYLTILIFLNFQRSHFLYVFMLNILLGYQIITTQRNHWSSSSE